MIGRHRDVMPAMVGGSLSGLANDSGRRRDSGAGTLPRGRGGRLARSAGALRGSADPVDDLGRAHHAEGDQHRRQHQRPERQEPPPSAPARRRDRGRRTRTARRLRFTRRRRRRVHRELSQPTTKVRPWVPTNVAGYRRNKRAENQSITMQRARPKNRSGPPSTIFARLKFAFCVVGPTARTFTSSYLGVDRT